MKIKRVNMSISFDLALRDGDLTEMTNEELSEYFEDEYETQFKENLIPADNIKVKVDIKDKE